MAEASRKRASTGERPGQAQDFPAAVEQMSGTEPTGSRLIKWTITKDLMVESFILIGQEQQ